MCECGALTELTSTPHGLLCTICWLREEYSDLDEWPCQQLMGGTGEAIYAPFVNGNCKHPECHPSNDDRQKSQQHANPEP